MYIFRWKSVLHTVQGCGDYDRLAQGVYENYLTLKLKGSSIKTVSYLYFYQLVTSLLLLEC